MSLFFYLYSLFKFSEKDKDKLRNKVQKHKYLIDFTMCNPPFFTCEAETCTMDKSKRNRSEPTAAPTGMCLNYILNDLIKPLNLQSFV